MSDLISRQAAIIVIENSGLDDDSKDTVVRVLEQLPSAQPERKSGKWKLLPNGDTLCSECGYMQVHAWDAESWDNYCHHCGADMRQREE